MNATAASLAASLSELHASLDAHVPAPLHGPLRVAEEARAAAVDGRKLLAGGAGLAESDRAALARLVRLAELLADGHGCMRPEHERDLEAADKLIEEVAGHCDDFIGPGTRNERMSEAVRTLEVAGECRSPDPFDRIPPDMATYATLARDVFDRVHLAQGHLSPGWDGLSHTDRGHWVEAMSHVVRPLR